MPSINVYASVEKHIRRHVHRVDFKVSLTFSEGVTMNQPLDLSILFNAPSADTPAEVLARIEIRCDQLGLFHSGDVLLNPLTKEERENLQWYLEENWKWPYEGFAERGQII